MSNQARLRESTRLVAGLAFSDLLAGTLTGSEANARLRTLLSKAREANMPVDNVDRAIKKGTGELPGVVFEEINYEGYGPGGVAFIVKVTTDNKQRAAKEW